MQSSMCNLHDGIDSHLEKIIAKNNWILLCYISFEIGSNCTWITYFPLIRESKFILFPFGFVHILLRGMLVISLAINYYRQENQMDELHSQSILLTWTKTVAHGLIINSTMVYVIVWHLTGDKLSSKPNTTEFSDTQVI